MLVGDEFIRGANGSDMIRTNIAAITYVFVFLFGFRFEHDRIRMDIDIVNMGFECSYMDTVSDVEYSNLDTNRSQLII